MGAEGWMFFLLGMLCASGGAACVFLRRERKLVSQIQKMLEDAAAGRFRERHLDETGRSMIESSLGKYLNSQEARDLRQKRREEQIQSQISDISHQAVLPISNILLYSQLLEEQLGGRTGQEEIQEELEAIREQAQTLDFLMEGLVKLSRLETGVIQIAANRQRLEPVLELVRRQFCFQAEEKGISLTVKSTDAEAVFDQKWTVEAVSNIVDNGLKYTKRGGKITLSVEQLSALVRLDISDMGEGIKEEEQAKVFSRFYRSEEAAGEPGLGIGLYISREVMRAQGGYIKLTSEKGRGSTFSLYFLR